MKTTSSIFVFALVLLAKYTEGGELKKCTEKDVCSSIVFNQLALSDIREDIDETIGNATSKLLQAAEEMRITTINLRKVIAAKQFSERDVEDCHKKSDSLGELITKFELATESLAEDNGLHEKKLTLQREKDTLVEETQALEAELKALQDDFNRQKEKILDFKKILSRPADCADVQLLGNTTSGVYVIYPRGSENPLEVYCYLDRNGGAWTVFMYRHIQEDQLDFNRSWVDYKTGFGNARDEYWIGNDLLYQMTSSTPSMLRMDAETFTGDKRYGEWDYFSVDSEDNNYRLSVSGYQDSSTMGDSITESNGKFFTTFDKDNDDREDLNCATGSTISHFFGMGPWWYSGCGSTRPTAPFANTNYWNSACYGYWDKDEFRLVSLDSIKLMFRRLDYEEMSVSYQSLCSAKKIL